jgi:hypothetical protein
MKQDIMSKLAALVEYLQAKNVKPVYVGAVPASIRGAFCVLSDASSTLMNDSLMDTDGSATEWTLSIYGGTPQEIVDLLDKAWAALNRPGETFKMGEYKVYYCRCTGDGFTTELVGDGAEETRFVYEMNVAINIYA